MFKWCTVQVDSLVLVTCAPRIEQCLGAIESELGVRVERSSGGIALTGSLAQINAANGRLLGLWLHQVVVVVVVVVEFIFNCTTLRIYTYIIRCESSSKRLKYVNMVLK